MAYTSSYTGEGIDAKLDQQDIVDKLEKNDLLNFIYPVGSIYMSVNNISPAAFLGGTWTQISDRFLLAAGSSYAAGSTGGAASVTSGGTALTVAQMPAHSHTVNAHSHGPTTSGWRFLAYNYSTVNAGVGETIVTAGTGSKVAPTVSNTGVDWGGIGATGNASPATDSKGSGSAHTHTVDTMPPYLTVYMWQRTA